MRVFSSWLFVSFGWRNDEFFGDWKRLNFVCLRVRAFHVDCLVVFHVRCGLKESGFGACVVFCFLFLICFFIFLFILLSLCCLICLFRYGSQFFATLLLLLPIMYIFVAE